MKIPQKLIKKLLGLLLIIFVAYAILCLLAKPVPNHPYFIPDKFLVIAHRGGPSMGPESTLYTFRNAVKLGVDVLEMDVRSTRDEQLIILHDDTVARTTNATGPVQNYTLVEMKKLDAAHRWSPDNGQTFPLRNKGVRIPTLPEVFKAFPRTKLNLEIKEARSSTIQSLCRLIRDHQMTNNVVVASFDTDSLKEFRRLCPQVATSAGASEARLFFGLQKAYLEAAYSPDAQVLQIPETLGDLRIVNKRFIDAAHARNMRVQVWLVNDVTSMQRLLELGVDGIMTDYPQRLMEVLKSIKTKWIFDFLSLLSLNNPDPLRDASIWDRSNFDRITLSESRSTKAANRLATENKKIDLKIQVSYSISHSIHLKYKEEFRMISVFSRDHRLHFGKYELIDGRFVTPFECPERMDAIMQRIAEVKLGKVIEPQEFSLDPIARVHAPEFIEFMRTAHASWKERHGDTDAMPICWPTRTFRQKPPMEIDGKLSYYSFDAGTPITAGTWPAITASINVALTGVELIQSGKKSVFSACRPPGHHAASDIYGGYCFFNNAAVAAQALLDKGAGRVALLDVDYHHGNGSQSIFYDRADVLYVSLHGDPQQEFPYFLGYADETGTKTGEGYNCNFPMPWGTGWDDYRECLDQGLERIQSFSPDALVISLGVDTYEKDPISKFKLKSEHFLKIGSKIAQKIHCPSLFIMEGGYAVDEIGINVVNLLTGYLNR